MPIQDNSFLIEGRAFEAGFKDVVRKWLWNLTIVPPKIMNFSNENVDRLMVHCRSAVVPGRTQEMITSNFGGMKQYFAGKPEFNGTFAVTIEETQDLFVRKMLNDWQEAIFSVDTGYSSVKSVLTGQKKDLVAPILELQLYKVDGVPVDYKFQFVNGIIQAIGDVSVAYSDGDSLVYDCTFQYDFWKLVKA